MWPGEDQLSNFPRSHLFAFFIHNPRETVKDWMSHRPRVGSRFIICHRETVDPHLCEAIPLPKNQPPATIYLHQLLRTGGSPGDEQAERGKVGCPEGWIFREGLEHGRDKKEDRWTLLFQ